MSRLRYIDGKRYLWRGILQMRAEQRRALATAQQLALFELKQDCRAGNGAYRRRPLS